MLYYTTALRRCQALPALRRRKMQPAGVSGGRKRQKARKNRLRPAAYASRLGKKRAFPLRKTRATQPAGPKNGSTPRCAVGNIKGGKRVAVRSPRAWGQGRFSAGFVQTAAFCPAPSRPDCRVVSRALYRWRFDPDCRSFSQASCRRRRAARLRTLPSAASPLRRREGGSPRSARRSPGPPSRCPAGGNSRRWRP